MIRIPPRSPLAHAMVAVLAACVLLDAVALRRALRTEPLDVPDRVSRNGAMSVPAFHRDTMPQGDDTLPDDPFDSDRGGVVTQAGEVASPPTLLVPEQPVSLVGTVVKPDGGGVAVCQVGNQPPRVLRIGERIGALTLLQVEQGRAAFRDSTGARVSLRIITPGA